MQILLTPCSYTLRPKDDSRPFIYGLVDPLDLKHVRYVGMAMRARRPYDHAVNASRDKKHSHLFHWIRLLQSEGREPAVIVLEELAPSMSRSFVGQIETMYIDSLKRIGHRLTNVAAGGFGGDTALFSEEARDRRRLLATLRNGQQCKPGCTCKRHTYYGRGKCEINCQCARHTKSGNPLGSAGVTWTNEQRAEHSVLQKALQKAVWTRRKATKNA